MSGGYNGSGTYVRFYNWVNDAANGINITASRVDTEDNGFATGLSTCVTRDGQSPWQANLPAGGFKITGLGNGSASGDSAALGQVFQISNNLSEGTAATMRTNLGLGSLATQAASAVAITGGTVTGTTVSGLTVTTTTKTLTLAGNLVTTGVHNTTLAQGADVTLTLPLVNATLATLAGTETFTNKTLTTPALTSPALSGTVTGAATIPLSILQHQNDQTICGNVSGGNASPIALTKTQSLTFLGIATATSSDLTISSAGTFSFTHGLGSAPFIVQFLLVCQSSEQGYTTGDVIMVAPGGAHASVTNGNHGFVPTITSTTITGIFGSQTSAFAILNGSTGTLIGLTNTNWKFRIQALALA